MQTLTTRHIAALVGVTPQTRERRATLVVDGIKERAFNEARYCHDLAEMHAAYFAVAVAAQGVQFMLNTGRLDAETTCDLRELRPYRVAQVVAKVRDRLDGREFGGNTDDARMIREIVKEVR